MTHIALITGGSRGLGRSMAQHLARTGMDVIFTYQSQQDEAQALVRDLEGLGRQAAALQLDVSQADSFAAFAQAVQAQLQTWDADHLYALVNNAGIGIHASFEQTSAEQLDRLYAIHVKGPFLLTQALLPLVQDGGRILNVSTGLTRFALPGYAAYATMKGAVETMTRYLAAELGERRISVNVLAPGAIETDFGGGAVRDNAQINEMIARSTALGRVGLPDDIGSVVATLLSPDAAWINAQRIEASGGQNL